MWIARPSPYPGCSGWTFTTLELKQWLKSSPGLCQPGHMSSVANQELLATPALSVSEVAELAGVAPSAVRFYEKHGVVGAVRTSGNQRRFDEDAPCLIKVAKVAQRVGLSVREIVEGLALLPPHPGRDDWGRVQRTLVEQAEARVADLKRQLAALESGDKLCGLT